MWLVAGIVILVLLRAAMVFRKRIKEWFSDDDNVTGNGFTLGDLRQLHKSGQLSDVEFETAKAVLLQGLGAGKK